MTHSDNFVDRRDGKQYRVIHLKDGNIWFAEDLRYETRESRTYEGKTGRYYSTLKIHQAIPPGWNIPSPYDWSNLYEIYGELPSELNILKDGRLEPSDTIGDEKYVIRGEDSTSYYLTGFHPQVGFFTGLTWGLFIRGLCNKSLLGKGDKSMSHMVMPHRYSLEQGFDLVEYLCRVRCLRKA